MAAFEFLRTCPAIDARGVALMGHSIGGVVSVIAAAQLPGARALVVNNAGLSWVRDGEQVGTAAVLRVWTDEAPRIERPVLVMHAADDAIVDPRLGDALVEALQRAQPAAPVVAFLDRYLKAR